MEFVPKFAKTLLPLLSSNLEEAKKEAIVVWNYFQIYFLRKWLSSMRKKMGFKKNLKKM